GNGSRDRGSHRRGGRTRARQPLPGRRGTDARCIRGGDDVMATVEAPEAATKAAKMNILSAINAALTDAMAEDDTVLVLGEDVADPEEGGVVGVTRGLSTRFGDARVRSTPISEQAIIGAAIGASLA